MSALIVWTESRQLPIGVTRPLVLVPGDFVELWSASGIALGPVIKVDPHRKELTIDSGGARVTWPFAAIDGGEIDGAERASRRVVLFHKSIQELP